VSRLAVITVGVDARDAVSEEDGAAVGTTTVDGELYAFSKSLTICDVTFWPIYPYHQNLYARSKLCSVLPSKDVNSIIKNSPLRSLYVSMLRGQSSQYAMMRSQWKLTLSRRHFTLGNLICQAHTKLANSIHLQLHQFRSSS
jgi:hypothetical protein